MFTLRHKDADLIRFDWLPDRGGRLEIRVPRAAARNADRAPPNLRLRKTGAVR